MVLNHQPAKCRDPSNECHVAMASNGRLSPIISLLENRVQCKQLPAVLSPSQVFSIVVFGSIVNEGYVNEGTDAELRCVFKKNEDACNYGIAIGIIAFFGCIFFFVIDIYFQQISSVKDRKRVVLLDLGFSGMPSGGLRGQWRLSRAGLRQSEALGTPRYRGPPLLCPSIEVARAAVWAPFSPSGCDNRTPYPLKQ